MFMTTIMPLNNVHDYHHGHDGDRVGGGGGILPCSPNAFNEDADDVAVVLAALLMLLVPKGCLLYTSPSPRDRQKSRMPSSA